MDFTKAFYDRVTSDALFTADLSVYAGAPAFFTDEDIPEDAALPYAYSHGQVSDVAWDTKNSAGRVITRDISVYVKRGSTAQLERMAERLRALFHRYPLTIDDATTIVAQVAGPVPAPTDETLSGRMITVKLKIEGI